MEKCLEKYLSLYARVPEKRNRDKSTTSLEFQRITFEFILISFKGPGKFDPSNCPAELCEA